MVTKSNKNLLLKVTYLSCTLEKAWHYSLSLTVEQSNVKLTINHKNIHPSHVYVSYRSTSRMYLYVHESMPFKKISYPELSFSGFGLQLSLFSSLPLVTMNPFTTCRRFFLVWCLADFQRKTVGADIHRTTGWDPFWEATERHRGLPQ